ncbi:hypothetical protein JAAARDRAFT_80184 [Jaapia argillacea MUCL 33604]|uniref:Uncharacterized protein n=1 Tax=Jaapia argillacea MUCL 33604 TaxID=933084 RepID=A0A067PL04_9AGAM|nr:hypothetical protein JAAARDRAFT_80184 [Jaapia argillacea MUCL 33604]
MSSNSFNTRPEGTNPGLMRSHHHETGGEAQDWTTCASTGGAHSQVRPLLPLIKERISLAPSVVGAGTVKSLPLPHVHQPKNPTNDEDDEDEGEGEGGGRTASSLKEAEEGTGLRGGRTSTLLGRGRALQRRQGLFGGPACRTCWVGVLHTQTETRKLALGITRITFTAPDESASIETYRRSLKQERSTQARGSFSVHASTPIDVRCVLAKMYYEVVNHLLARLLVSLIAIPLSLDEPENAI